MKEKKIKWTPELQGLFVNVMDKYSVRKSIVIVGEATGTGVDMNNALDKWNDPETRKLMAEIVTRYMAAGGRGAYDIMQITPYLFRYTQERFIDRGP